MKSLCGFAVVGLLALVALLTLRPGQAFAAQVHCGEVITQDTTVENDLIDCPGDGLVIGADDVTLDLNGHTIDGVEKGTGVAVGGRSGVGDFFGYDRVTIENGTIRQFGTGILFESSEDGIVRHLDMSLNSSVIHVSRSSVSIEQNNVHDNAGFIGSVFGTMTVERNRLVNNAGGVGIAYGGGVIRRNYVFGNRFSGIGGAEVSYAQIENNVIANNGGDGIGLAAQVDGNRIVGNKVSHNGRDGIALESLLLFTGDSGGNEIVNNDASDNGRNGIFLDWNADRNFLERNTTDRNGEDGIHVGRLVQPVGTNTLTKNKARRNADLGIETSPSTIDGGGNQAFGNGNPLQCLNVVCK